MHLHESGFVYSGFRPLGKATERVKNCGKL